ncbi:MAG: fumarate reductase/succinate dehydrogenase flavoprotein subunit [Verrucomicrobia bacterium]|nr:fumarate reductase/succinate dehydrogenase flavoprotein subunit [Verrucomicrobiota bacterium]
MKLDARIPAGPLAEKWSRFRREAALLAPARRGQFEIVVVGTGLAGSSAAATLAEQGYRVKAFCFQDSARRAHSVAAQGGVNAAKNYRNDGDGIWRMFADTLRGGDFRAREANVYRLAECSRALIDQAVAQGVPFARDYAGYLDNRSFGGVQVSRTFYARGQTGQQLLLGAYQALQRQAAAGRVQLFPWHEMLDLVVADGRAAGIVARDLATGAIERHPAHAVLLATGGFGKIYHLSTLALGCNGSAIWRAHQRGAGFAAPSWTQIHPTCLPQSGDYQSKLTLMSESLRNDGRVWVPARAGDERRPNDIPEAERDYYLERRYPAYGNLAPRDISSRAAKERIDAGHGVGALRNAVYLDFRDARERLGERVLRERYGNLFAMYEKITAVDPLREPMLISPAAHFSMGGLWVDYGLMTTIPGLFALGEANFADHGANRLGANSLLQACVDGYYVAPMTVSDHLARTLPPRVPASAPEFAAAEQSVRSRLARLVEVGGRRPADAFHRELGRLLYAHCGLARNAAGLTRAIEEIRTLRQEFWRDLRVTGSAGTMNQELEKAGRVADYLELGELMCRDALAREESCGAHFREEHQTPEGEAKRDDLNFAYVPVWEWRGPEAEPALHREPLHFEALPPVVRSYR